MTLDFGVVALVLLAAVLHATWNAFVKAGADRLAVLTLAVAAPAPLCALALPFVPLPEMASWPYLGASIVHPYRLLRLPAVRLPPRRSEPSLPDRPRQRAGAGRNRRLGLGQ